MEILEEMANLKGRNRPPAAKIAEDAKACLAFLHDTQVQLQELQKRVEAARLCSLALEEIWRQNVATIAREARLSAIHEARLIVARTERRTAIRDYVLFIAGVVCATIVSVLLRLLP